MKLNKIIAFFICSLIICFPVCSLASTDDLQIYSEATLLFDNTTGKILYDKNKSKRMYPASTTKILTAAIVLENCKLTDQVKVSQYAVSLLPPGYSSAGLKADEVVTIEQLLNLLLIYSANDAANILAIHVSGSIDKFAEKMNEKAQEIGCTHSHFTNPSGQHDNNHYSTTVDLAKIAKYAMQNETFRSIVKTVSYTMPATNLSPEKRFTNTNALLRPGSERYYYPYTIGIKTGYTSQAKDCLISAGNKDGFELICVVLGGGETPDGLNARFLDSKNLLAYGYDNYEVKDIVKKDETIFNIEVSYGTKETKNLNLLATDDVKVTVKKDVEPNTLSPNVVVNEFIEAPIQKGTVLGKAIYTIDGVQYEQNLVASHNVEKINYMNYIWFGILCFSILSIISLIIYYLVTRNKVKNISELNVKCENVEINNEQNDNEI